MLSQAYDRALHNEQEGSALFHSPPSFFISSKEDGREVEQHKDRENGVGGGEIRKIPVIMVIMILSI